MRNQSWNPNKGGDDREQRNAMAARGYYQAFQAVKESITKVLNNDNPGIVVDDDHGTWYREPCGAKIIVADHLLMKQRLLIIRKIAGKMLLIIRGNWIMAALK